MTRIAVFPGSFDPITKGHEDIVTRALPLFDKIIVAIGVNADKKHMFSVEQREAWIGQTFAHSDRVSVDRYTGLTVDYCRQKNASFILRGVRNAGDLNFEMPIAQMNRLLEPQVETVFLTTTPDLAPYSSTVVRDVLRNGGSVRRFIPQAISIDEVG